MHKPSSTLPSLISELQAEMRRSPHRAHLHELARRRIEAPHEIIDWAKRDRRWSFTLAEILNEPIAMPRELAARLLVAIVDELEQERRSVRRRARRKLGNRSRRDTSSSALPSDSCFGSVNDARLHFFRRKFFAQPRDRAVYDRFMKLIGRKTVKGARFRRPR